MRQVYDITDYLYAGIKSPNDLLITERSLVLCRAYLLCTTTFEWTNSQSESRPVFLN